MEHWFAVFTNAQKESLAARELRRLGFETFWPHTTAWVDAGHKAKSRLVRRAWLSRYLFVRTDKEKLWAVNEAMGVSTVVRAPGGEPYPVPEKAMQLLRDRTDHLGEVFTESMTRRVARCRVGDIIRIKDEKHPLFGFYVEAKKVLDNGVVQALFSGGLLGSGEIFLTNPDVGEVVTRGAVTSDPRPAAIGSS